MTIAIIGAGHVGSALADGWTRAGHTVIIGERGRLREAALAAEVVLVAVPGGVVGEVAAALGDLGDRVVLDATNVVGAAMPDGRNPAALREATRSPHVVKAFNTTGFENMRDPKYGDQAIDMFVAGASAHGKAVATTLAHDVGFGEVWDLGGDEKDPAARSAGAGLDQSRDLPGARARSRPEVAAALTGHPVSRAAPPLVESAMPASPAPARPHQW